MTKTIPFEVVIDTREKNPWCFENTEYVTGIINEKLDTGDYAIKGLEDKLCIERKQSVAEFAKNLTQDNFKDELRRMEKIEHRFLLLEFSMEDVIDYPMNSNIPKRRWEFIRVQGKHILGFIDSIQLHRKINILFCGNRRNARDTAHRLMKKCQTLYIE